MTEPRTESVLRAWLEAEAARSVPSPELLERIANVPRSSAPARPVVWTARRAIAIGLAAALLIGALAAAAAIVGHPPDPGLRLGQLSYVLDDGVYVADSDGRNARRVSDGLGVGGPFGVPRWHGPVLTFTGGDDGRAFARVATDIRDITGHFDWAKDAVSGGGNRFASLSAERLVVRTLDGSIVASLAPPTGYAMWDVSDLETLSWLGNDVLVASACRDAGNGCLKGSGDGHDLFIVRLDGSVPRRITSQTRVDLPRVRITRRVPDRLPLPAAGCPLGLDEDRALGHAERRHRTPEAGHAGRGRRLPFHLVAGRASARLHAVALG